MFDKKKWYQDNKKRLKEKAELYYQNNKESVDNRNKKYYQNNKESVDNRNKKYYQNNKEKISKTHKKYKKENKIKIQIQNYKYNDKKKNLICDLTEEWMKENISFKSCIYCGKTENIGCDRIDNSKGHTKDNVVPCCPICNYTRGDRFSFSQMLRLGEVIRQFRIEGGLNG